MRISSLFPAIVTAVAAAGFALTEPAPQIVGSPNDLDVATRFSPAPIVLAAFDPLSLAPRATDDVR